MKLVFVLAALFAAAPAGAYPWMIAHPYASCAACHVDPSGGGQLTAYGHGMSDVIVRWHPDQAAAQKEMDENGPSTSSLFAFGLVPLPDWLNISGNLRGGAMAIPNTNGTVTIIPLIMATDEATTLEVGPVVAHFTIGYQYEQVNPESDVVIQPDPTDPKQRNALVSRDHWLGVKLLDGSLELRAGRIPLPFGLRNNEHTSFVRDQTRTNIDNQQQDGLAVWYANDFLRTEVMAIAGNYQIQPDAVRERGYSGYLEFTPIEHVGLGLSSELLYTAQDLALGVPAIRQAHGVFARWGPNENLALMFEGDALLKGHGHITDVGGAGWLAVDYAPVNGVHFQQAFETTYAGNNTQALPTLGGWVGAAWYCLPHTELRIDGIYEELYPITGGAIGTFTGLVQVHLFL